MYAVDVCLRFEKIHFDLYILSSTLSINLTGSAPRSVTSCHVSPLGTKHLRMSANVVTGQPQLAEMVWNVGTVMKGPMVFHFF